MQANNNEILLCNINWTRNGLELPYNENIDTDAVSSYMESIAVAMAEEVGEKFGEEFGEAFRGYVDNGDGIWFEGLDVDYDTFTEIYDFCIALVGNREWRATVDNTTTIEA